jgi:hypothetical protein
MVHSLPEEAWFDPGLNTDYDLVVWSCSLVTDFPFLFGEHVKTSYHRHYLIWKLSKIAGINNSDMSIDFDNELIVSPEGTIRELLRVSGIDADVDRLSALVVKPETGKWGTAREEGWFEKAEAECDDLLEELSLSQYFGRRSIDSIRKKSSRVWKKYDAGASRAAIDSALSLFCRLHSSHIKLGYNSRTAISCYQERLKYIATACDLRLPLTK